GLSTATALWARGERGDAIVWLRRAAEAAENAGQGGRSAELGMWAARLEMSLEGQGSPAMPPVAEVAQLADSDLMEGDRPSSIEIEPEPEEEPAPRAAR